MIDYDEVVSFMHDSNLEESDTIGDLLDAIMAAESKEEED